jgi:hypothetical protein
MTLAELRNMVLWRVRSVLPEVTDWNTLLRFMRTAGNPALQSWEVGLDQDMFEEHAKLALTRYGELTKLFRSEVEVQWSPTALDIEYRSLGIVEPIVVYWRPDTNSDYQIVQKVFEPPIRKRASLERGRPRIWWLMGQRIAMHPIPRPNELVLIDAVLEPYWTGTAQEIVGVDPSDFPMIAQWIASYYIEWQNIQLATAWRQEAENMFMRRGMQHAWYVHNRRRAVRWHRR